MLTTEQISQEETFSARSLQHLRTTSRWVRFFGVLGFISSIFTLVGAFGAITGILTNDTEISAVWSILAVAFFIGMVVMSFYLSFVLFDYGSKTKQFVVKADYEQLAQSFKRQLTYWKLVGILVTVTLGFYLLYFVFIIAVTANGGNI